MKYDGKRIPFRDNAFDLVFSSNVLEHIPHIVAFQAEIRRVLKKEGCVIHILPSGSWRAWTNVSHVLRRWKWPRPHGEHAANAVSEIVYFSRHYWANLFQKTGWHIVAYRTNKLFYTGQSIFDRRLSIAGRRRLSTVLGSSCHIYVLRPAQMVEPDGSPP